MGRLFSLILTRYAQDVFIIPEGAAGAMAELERCRFTAEDGVSFYFPLAPCSVYPLHSRDHLTLLNGLLDAPAYKNGISFVASLQCFCQVLRTTRDELSSAIKNRQRMCAAEAIYAALWYMATRKVSVLASTGFDRHRTSQVPVRVRPVLNGRRFDFDIAQTHTGCD
jgi:hypothetical protein